ncbi:ead/Ea22-like family protein [Escherichia coli]|nr:ead/Ea22-like family protein [Escherichia coli]
MSKIDYQALREKAEKATCGEWALEYGDGRFDGDDALIHREAAGYIPICRIEGAHPDANDGWIIPGASWKPSHWMQLPEPPQESQSE